MTGQLAVEDRLAQRAQQRRVVGGQQVDGAAHHDAHGGARFEHNAQLLGPEVAAVATAGRGRG